jgi:hypothetical protein
LGPAVDEATNSANANRVPIKTAIENYLYERRFGLPRSLKIYENISDQLSPSQLSDNSRNQNGKLEKLNSSTSC